jgi:putative toxin-antitoxin system antitoxin component (TIGR02293 family)
MTDISLLDGNELFEPLKVRLSRLTTASHGAMLRQMAAKNTSKGAKLVKRGKTTAGAIALTMLPTRKQGFVSGGGRTIDRASDSAVVQRAKSRSASSFVGILFSNTDPLQIRNAIVGGSILGSRLRDMRHQLDITVDVMAHLLDVAPRTINRKESSAQPLSVSEGDRAFRIARIADLAIELIGNREKALAWLHRPNTFLGGKIPIEMLDTEIGADFVAESLHSIAYGGVA